MRGATDPQSMCPAERFLRQHRIDEHVGALFWLCSPMRQEQIMEIGIEDVDDPSAALQSLIQHSKSWAPLVDYSPGCSHTSPRRRKPKPPDCPPPDHLMARSLRLDVSQPAAASIVATALLKSTPVVKYLIMMMSLRTRPIACLDVICWQRWG